MFRNPLILASALAALAGCQSSPATTETAVTPTAATANAAGTELASCQTPANDEATAKAHGQLVAAVTGTTYGATTTANGAHPVAELKQLLGTHDSLRVKLVGKADAVCQAKGCWLTMKTPEGQEMRVRFKDYAFFVPKDITGKTVVIDGWAHREEVPLADLKHYAQDAGKSEKEIAAITEPEQQLNFEAAGVLVAN